MQAAALVDAGDASNDPKVRNKAYGEAFRLVAERAHFFPLFTYVKTYAKPKGLNFKPSPDDRARFYRASWKRWWVGGSDNAAPAATRIPAACRGCPPRAAHASRWRY